MTSFLRESDASTRHQYEDVVDSLKSPIHKGHKLRSSGLDSKQDVDCLPEETETHCGEAMTSNKSDDKDHQILLLFWC